MNIIKPGDICEFQVYLFMKTFGEKYYCICSDRKFNFKRLRWEYVFYDLSSNQYYTFIGDMWNFIPSLEQILYSHHDNELNNFYSYFVKKI